MLSKTDIIRELNKNIFIYPLTPDNIKGSTVNLIASEWAWSLKTKLPIVQNISGKNIIVIPDNDTALIETKEAIHVTQKIAGTYHSKVMLVSKGLSHIGTTLDPMFCGNSLIAIHNNSGADYNLPVGESFVSLIFYPLKSKSFGNNTNIHGQTEILSTIGIPIPAELSNDEWRKTPEGIIEKCNTEDEIKKITKLKKSISVVNPKLVPHLLGTLLLIIIGVCFYFFKHDLYEPVFLVGAVAIFVDLYTSVTKSFSDRN